MDTEQKAISVPMDFEFKPSWLSWVGATTTCLNALGLDCDLADVAGMSGYAFHMAINTELCPSGPTMLDLGILERGVHVLGRGTMSYSCSDTHGGRHDGKDDEFTNDRTRAHCRVVHELAHQEVAAGRPCVIWGAYLPEFAVVYGFDADGKYLVKSIKKHCGEPEPPLAYDELDAPGGPYLLAFPAPVAPSYVQPWGDQLAVGRAAQLLKQPSMLADYGTAVQAYDTWIAALESGKLLDFGNAYNAQCYCEGKAFARDFLPRVAERNPLVAEPLNRAAEAYRDVAAAMKRVGELFPFPPGKQSEDPQVRAKAIPLLKEAQAAESRAADSLSKAVRMQWKAEAAKAEGAN